jgi:hypothetical protein
MKRLVVAVPIALLSLCVLAAPAFAWSGVYTSPQTFVHTYNDGDGTGNHHLTYSTWYSHAQQSGTWWALTNKMSFRTDGPAVSIHVTYSGWLGNQWGETWSATYAINGTTKYVYPSNVVGCDTGSMYGDPIMRFQFRMPSSGSPYITATLPQVIGDNGTP